MAVFRRLFSKTTVETTIPASVALPIATPSRTREVATTTIERSVAEAASDRGTKISKALLRVSELRSAGDDYLEACRRVRKAAEGKFAAAPALKVAAQAKKAEVVAPAAVLKGAAPKPESKLKPILELPAAESLPDEKFRITDVKEPKDDKKTADPIKRIENARTSLSNLKLELLGLITSTKDESIKDLIKCAIQEIESSESTMPIFKCKDGSALKALLKDTYARDKTIEILESLVDRYKERKSTFEDLLKDEQEKLSSEKQIAAKEKKWAVTRPRN